MFPSFIGILDIQSWWEVPSIAYFCSLFRTAFNLLDFDIEELEEALLTDGSEESASSLLTELIVRLLNGCLGNNDISAFNYQMYLRRLFRRKCQDTGRYNPFNTDIDFQFLPLRTKVEILYSLCDFRLDAEDVFDLFKNLEAESLRVEPLGYDSNDSAYWYFYGTRLYREDVIKKPKGKNKKKKEKESKKRGWFYGDDWLEDDESERVWQVVCFTEEDWTHLTQKFSKATTKVEKELYRSLSQNFLPEIPRLFQEKEKLQRKRLLELQPRRTSSRVLQKIKQKEEELKLTAQEVKEEKKETLEVSRESRAKRRNLLRSKSVSSDTSSSSESDKEKMPQKRSRSQEKPSKNSSATQKGEPPPEVLVKTGRKTNNSLSAATGQIVIPDDDEPVNSTRKKLKTSQIFGQTEEDIQTDMYKVLEQLTAHEDAWPFMDPVEEEYAPNYYAVIRRPMDLRKMEERLDNGYYTDFSMFKADFKLIVNNCRLYNGQDNEYTLMVDNLQTAFERLTEKYMHRLSSSDEEIAVEYQLPTPSRKPKRKSSESPSRHKKKKRKLNSESGEPKSSSSAPVNEDNDEEQIQNVESKKSKESHKNKDGKTKKKRKGHHRHGKHSKNHKKDSAEESSRGKHNKKQKRGKEKESKKSKQKRKKNKHQEVEDTVTMKRSTSQESLESWNRSRSASPLPSIHTPSPTPSPTLADRPPSEPLEPEPVPTPDPLPAPDPLPDPDFFKDKYDKIKERRRNAAKDAWESLFEYKQKTLDKQKQNLNIPEKDKNQKLRETIEKLKAKSEKYNYGNALTTKSNRIDKLDSTKSSKDIKNKDNETEYSDEDASSNQKNKTGAKKTFKKNSAKNESASEALEQAVKDISKWLDDAPKGSALSSPCDSPTQTISTEEQDNSRLDDELSQGEKSLQSKKDTTRKRPSSREPKLIKRREIQRTIERLQPGKSKGNLLTNIAVKNIEKVEDVTPLGPMIKVREANKVDECSPKLSLGSVLPTVEFTLGNDHNFGKCDEEQDKNETSKSGGLLNVSVIDNEPVKNNNEELKQTSTKKDAEVETEQPEATKPNQEKATPNLSAWFKAFGTPKNTVSATTIKKKSEDLEPEDKVNDSISANKVVSPKISSKYDSPTDTDTPNPDGGDSPLPSISANLRQRRTSTNSSVSERSSFSQDLDSPRHQMCHNSPLLRSPASPRTDDFQKITYPIINGTVRAGFYQDTTSLKSSPEKSCSPREGPQSPYSPYSQHVYASNSGIGSTTPNYFVDHSKSPLPTYGQNPPPYYDTSKVTNKPARVHEDYTALGPDTYQLPSQFSEQFSPAQSPYQQHSQSSNYSQSQHPAQLQAENLTPTHHTSAQISLDTKSTLFPVKKRTYNEPEQSPVTSNKLEDKDNVTARTPDYIKMPPVNFMPTVAPATINDIAAALSEKSELNKINTSIEQTKSVNLYEHRQPASLDNKDIVSDKKQETENLDLNKPIDMNKKDNIDLMNIGYLSTEIERRNNMQVHDLEIGTRNNSKGNVSQHKGYEVESIAINLGMNHQHLQKPKTSFSNLSLNTNNIPPAHSNERSQNNMIMNQNLVHAHHNQYESISSNQHISNFSLNDIEQANKKLYTCNKNSAGPSSVDYGTWKMSNQMRKQDIVPSDFSSAYNTSNVEKTKNDINLTNSGALNYNKNIQVPYHNYNVPRHNVQRPPEMLQNVPAELRIPNPRGIKDHGNIVSSMGETEISNKSIDTLAKSQKQDKLAQNHQLTGSPYKTPYSTHSLQIDSLRNLPSISPMLERYANDERYLSSFAANSSLYHDKTFQMAQMFNKSIASEVQPSNTAASIYSQSTSLGMSKDSSSAYKTTNVTSSQTDSKAKNKRKKAAESKPQQIIGNQNYHTTTCGTDVLSSVKTSIVPGSAFNFGASNMGLGSGLYGDNSGFSIEDFRNSTNQLMAANYMAAAVAHQQRNSAEASVEKLAKPAHQNSSHSSGSFPFIGHSQVRAGYPFVSAETSSSPLYQQYLQRHQEELLRQTGAQIMGLYPPGYPAAALGVRQPYDINRPSWL